MSHETIRPFDNRESPDKTNLNPETGFNDMKARVSDMASNIKDKAGQVAEVVSEKLGQQRENAAGTLGRVASSMHENADSVPGGTKAVDLTHSIADGVESTASYLRTHDFRQMGKDVTNICRRYPTQSVIAALTIGFLLGRSARRK
jgi:methyl-accepting chemotaxis protein